MRTRLLLCGVFAVAAASAVAAPPPKDTTATPEETVTAEPAGGTDIEKARARAKSSNNLKQIVLAAHNFQDANASFPRDVYDANGKAILSWRVQLLPYLVNDNLWKQFRMDEPWDGKNNKPLLEKMPEIFASPRVKVKAKGYTVYQGFAGNGALFGSNRQLGIQHITDGTSNTLFAVEATAAVPWTKPADVPYDEKKDLPDFGKAFDSKPLAAMCDGSTRVLDTKKISMATLKAAVTPNGGEILGADWNN
jgi:hypothetical protein